MMRAGTKTARAARAMATVTRVAGNKDFLEEEIVLARCDNGYIGQLQ